MIWEYLAGVYVGTIVMLTAWFAASEMTVSEKRALDGYVKGL